MKIKIEEYIDTKSGEKLKREIYYDEEEIICERYYLDGKLHREDGPAIINYINSKIVGELYYLNNKKHRKNGPAVIFYYEDGEIQGKGYYLNNIECDILQEVLIKGLEIK